MNDYHLLSLAHHIAAERRAEADRYRLAKSRAAKTSSSPRAPRQRRREAAARDTLRTLLHRLAI